MNRNKMLLLVVALVVILGGAYIWQSTKSVEEPPSTSAEPSSATPASPTAELAKDVYKNGDVITIIVPYAAGGGFDVVARLMQPYFEAEIEAITSADVSIVVQNMNGASGVTGNSFVYRAPADGKTLMTLGLAAAPFLQLINPGTFDLEKYTYLGQLNTDPTALVVGKDSPINSFDDFIKLTHERTLLIGSGGIGSSGHMELTITQAVLKKYGVDLNVDFVHYAGVSEELLGLQKGEFDAMLVTESSATNQVANGDMKAISIYSREPARFLTGAKTLIEENVPGAEQLIDTIGMSRVLAGPPGLSPEVTAVLEEALMKALGNPELIEKAETAGLRIDYADAEAAAATSLARLAIARENEAVIKEATN